MRRRSRTRRTPAASSTAGRATSTASARRSRSGESLAGAEGKYDAPSGTNTNKITLNWTAVSGATGYKVYRGTATGEELLLATLGAVTTYVDDTNATPAGAMPTSDTSSGVGIAVGVTVAVVTTKAYLAGNAVLDATDVTVEALGPGSGDSAFSAHATSGAGGSSVGVAGSIAVNIVVADTIADVETPTPVVVNGNLSLIATSSLTNDAVAEAKQESGGNTSGIGASVALNVVNDTTRAGLADGSVLTGAQNLTITATAHRHDDDDREGRRERRHRQPRHLGAGRHLDLEHHDERLDRHRRRLTHAGALAAHATQTAKVTTTATGATKGGNAAIGLTLALTSRTTSSTRRRSATSPRREPSASPRTARRRARASRPRARKAPGRPTTTRAARTSTARPTTTSRSATTPRPRLPARAPGRPRRRRRRAARTAARR